MSKDTPTKIEPLLKWIWRSYFYTALVPLLLMTGVLVAIYLMAGKLARDENINAMRQVADDELLRTARRETVVLQKQLESVTKDTRLLAKAAEHALLIPLNPGEIPPDEHSRYVYGDGGVYYSPQDDGGSVVYYSGIVPVGERERDKVLRSSRLDTLLRNLHENNPLVALAYLNTFDSLTRIYPFVSVLQHFPPHLDVSSFNFYYEADAQHNSQRKVVWTDVYIDPAGQGWIASSIAPVYNGDFLEGVVGLDITVEMLVQKILGLQIPWEGYGILVGKNGTILALPPPGEQDLGLAELKENHYPEAILKDTFKPDEFNLYKRSEFNRLVEEMQNLPSGLGKIPLHGKPCLAAWSTVPETGWKLLLLVSEEKIYAQAIKLDQRLKRLGTFLVGGLSLFYGVFFVVISRRTKRMSHFLASPLIKINALADRIGTGDYHQVPPRFSVQELDDMARQLAAMGDQLGENNSTLLQTQESLNRERALLRSLIDAIPDLIFYKNTAGIYLSCNEAFADSLARSQAEIVNKTDFDLLPKELAATLQENDRQVFATGKPRRDEESLERLDGRHTVVETLKTPFFSQEGEVLGLIGISRDIEQRKRWEEALENAKQAAEAASRAKSEFLARMSHEIRTPLNGVLGMAELLQATPLNAQQQRFTGMILSSGRTLLAIINKILDFSKIEAGRLELEMVPFDVRELVEDTVALLARSAHEKGLDLISDLPMNLPASVQSDPVHLRQILVNLMDNAIKFTERGEVVIRLRVLAQDAEASWLRFEIRDTGIGIAPAARAKIFDSFTQADDPTSRRYGGTGLGLAISRQLVRLMGGEIDVDSTPGVGSRFWFTVPLQQPVMSTRPFWLGRMVLRGFRALIVDDNATQRKILHLQVTAWGMVNDTVASGAEALALLREAFRLGEHYDLVILDRQMPVMDGIELARQIRADPGLDALKLLMLISSEVEAEATQAVQVGIQATLHKPVRQAEIYKTLCRLLGQVDGPVSQRPSSPALRPPRLAGRVLVAEDNPSNQEVALAVLEQLGCQAEVVANGREAVEAVTRTAYDLVLMDCHMPVLDGFAATTEIRRQERIRGAPPLPIIALTANVIKGFREQCLAVGMNDYLSKPFEQAQLKEILERWLPTGSAQENKTGLPCEAQRLLDPAKNNETV